jgi:hypothetical protein
MNNIKIVRLSTGEDIIAAVTENGNGTIMVNDPMMFELSNRNDTYQISMAFYLPVQLIKKNQMIMSADKVLCVSDPTDSFAEYYINSIQKMQQLMELRETLDDSNIPEETMNKVITEAFEQLDINQMTKH